MNPFLYPRDALTCTTVLSPMGELKLSSLKNGVVWKVSLNRSMSRTMNPGPVCPMMPIAMLSKSAYVFDGEETPPQNVSE